MRLSLKMEISDDELRKELSKYMDPVPAVTGYFSLSLIVFVGSTREVLRAKLAKLQAAETKGNPLPNNHIARLEPSTER